jgi:peptidoglycan-associated lipoprotein
MLRGISAFFAIFLITACGSSKPDVKTPPPSAATESPVEQPAPTVAKKAAPVERAEGELREVLITLQRVHFGYDSAQLSEDSRAALAEAAEKLNRQEGVHLYVDGHADQRGTGEYNIALGERRANTVSDYLKHMGVAADRLHIVSFGKEKPITERSDKVGLAKNRRVDFRLMRGEVRLVLEEGTLLDDQGQPISTQ